MKDSYQSPFENNHLLYFRKETQFLMQGKCSVVNFLLPMETTIASFQKVLF